MQEIYCCIPLIQEKMGNEIYHHFMDIISKYNFQYKQEKENDVEETDEIMHTMDTD